MALLMKNNLVMCQEGSYLIRSVLFFSIYIAFDTTGHQFMINYKVSWNWELIFKAVKTQRMQQLT